MAKIRDVVGDEYVVELKAVKGSPERAREWRARANAAQAAGLFNMSADAIRGLPADVLERPTEIKRHKKLSNNVATDTYIITVKVNG